MTLKRPSFSEVCIHYNVHYSNNKTVRRFILTLPDWQLGPVYRCLGGGVGGASLCMRLLHHTHTLYYRPGERVGVDHLSSLYL